MVDSDLRKSLSQDVRRLVTGRMTNDDFDDAYYEHYDSSDDRAVREIAGFCYSLYSSDLLLPMRLRGRHALDAETKCSCTRAVLFLRSDLEYEWQPFPDDPGLRTLSAFAYMGIPAGIALLLVGTPLALSGDLQFGGPFFAGGLFTLIGSVWFCRSWPKMLEPQWKSFRDSGDYDVWPFLRQSDFEHANGHCHLLGRTVT